MTGSNLLDARQVTQLVDRWATEGLIDPGQASRMRGEIAALPGGAGRAEPGRAGSVAIEALGYLGGVIVVVGLVLLGARYWEDLGSGLRLGVVAGVGAILQGAGWLSPARRGGAPARLRAVLWLSSTVAAGGALALLAGDVLDLGGADRLLVLGLGTAAYAAALWRATPALLQQAAMMVAGALAAAALVNRADVSSDLPGVGVWAVGLAWALLGHRGVLAPGRIALALGTAMAIFGAMLTGGSDAGLVLILVTVGAAVVGAVLAQDLLLLGVAALGALLNVPVAMQRWLPDSAAAALALVIVGLTLVAVAVWIARHDHGGPSRPGAPGSALSRPAPR